MKDKNMDLGKIRTIAEEYYRNGDFYCSEAIVKAIKDEFELDVSDDVIKMASGFPLGMGNAGCTCGAVAGGVMVLGLIFGRSEAKDKRVKDTMKLSKELHDIFKEKNKSVCCRALTKNMIKGSKKHTNQCIYFTGDVAYETAKIICREKGITMVENDTIVEPQKQNIFNKFFTK